MGCGRQESDRIMLSSHRQCWPTWPSTTMSCTSRSLLLGMQERTQYPELQSGLVMSKLCNIHTEIIIESPLLLTNLVLWVLWHYAGRFQVVVSGRATYGNDLGPEDTILECRVAKFCSKECYLTSRDHSQPPTLSNARNHCWQLALCTHRKP